MNKSTLCMALLFVLTATSRISASLPPPPGGHHPLYLGGDNTAGYPPIVTSGVAERTPETSRGPLFVTASPNPFRERTVLELNRVSGEVRVRIFATTGRQVRELVSTGRAEGTHLEWNGLDSSGAALPSGVYFYRVDSGRRSAVGRLVLLRDD